MHTVSFEWIPGVLPLRDSARVMLEVLKTVVHQLLIHQHAGRAVEVRAIDNDLLLGIERF
jgi:hypothetical protein